MQQSSDSIAQLAAALAKAQIELVNPQKTLTGTIDRWGNGGVGQSYRYAPLSAGLDIVRKALCKHELAVIQTTHVDQKSDVLMLTTTLAHGSGEFICATWPVCRTSDLTNPKMMGAALTYARRYGLFTLVGLAGEDDLDGPDLAGEEGTTRARSSDQVEQEPMPERLNERLPARDQVRRRRRDAGVPRGPRKPNPVPDQAPLSELVSIEDEETLFRWALKALPLRNNLSEAERRIWDEEFLATAQRLGTQDVALAPEAKTSVPNGLYPHAHA
jgi:hypothetical protein